MNTLYTQGKSTALFSSKCFPCNAPYKLPNVPSTDAKNHLTYFAHTQVIIQLENGIIHLKQPQFG